jgi:enterochelin esterase-like enzyme
MKPRLPKAFALFFMVVASMQAACVLAAPAFRSVAEDARGETLRFDAPGIDPDGLRVRVLLPPEYDRASPLGYAVLYLNDGQDAEAVSLRSQLDALIVSGEIAPVIAVAIDMPKDRLAAYGFSDREARRSLPAASRAGTIGANAHAYTQWIANTLVPAIDARYRTRARPDARAILGWSLGGANAFNLGWHRPGVFGRVGAFSPSFWLPADNRDADAAQRTRIAQTLVAAGQYRPGSKFFFAVGDAEETDDRDGDGVIDVLDDARDLMEGWRVAGEVEPRAKGLRQLGHSTNLTHAAAPSRADAALYVLPGGEHRQRSWARMLPVFLRWAYALRAPALQATGTTESWQGVPSRHVGARDVDVWLPPSYGHDPSRRYPVLYMHDGQNLFDPALSYTGVDWDIDGAMTRLIGSGIFGRPMGLAKDIRSDDYLRFLVEELKPFVDARYRTLPGRDDTFVMGSSMGGLISLYAAARYPQIFGGVGAVSTHFPACGGCVIDWFGAHLPDPGTHRLYLDHGTATLDAKYPPYQARMDAVLRAGGYREGDNWITRRFEGAEHNEAAWKARVEIPLRFLLAR